jgi:hypothetical protein
MAVADALLSNCRRKQGLILLRIDSRRHLFNSRKPSSFELSLIRVPPRRPQLSRIQYLELD